MRRFLCNVAKGIQKLLPSHVQITCVEILIYFWIPLYVFLASPRHACVCAYAGNSKRKQKWKSMYLLYIHTCNVRGVLIKKEDNERSLAWFLPLLYNLWKNKTRTKKERERASTAIPNLLFSQSALFIISWIYFPLYLCQWNSTEWLYR